MSCKKTVPVLFACFLTVAACPRAFGQTSVSLQQAVKQGLVEVDVKSRGGATGDAIRVYVRRKVPREVRIHITPGTVLLTVEKDIQNVTARRIKGEFIDQNTYRPSSVMVLVDNNRHSYLVESFCLDYQKKAPKRGQSLTLAVNDQRAARILNAPKDVKASPWAFQLALWMDRTGVAPAEVQRRHPNRLTAVDVRVARSLLQNAEKQGIAEIPQGIDVDVRVQIKKLFSTDPAVRAVAVDSLGGMGSRAAVAAPFLRTNVIRGTSGKTLPSTVVSVFASPAAVSVELERLGIPALGPLIEHLKQPGAGGTSVLVDTTDLLDKDRMTEFFIGRLKHDNPRVRQRAAKSLKRLTGEDFSEDHAKWHAWWQKKTAQ